MMPNAPAPPSSPTPTPPPPFDPNPANDGTWVPNLAPADRLTYATAKQAYDQATITYNQKLAAAQVPVDQLQAKFEAAQAVAVADGSALSAAVTAANGAKDAIGTVPDIVLNDDLTDPTPITTQLTAVKAAMTAYQSANTAAMTAQATYATDLAALAKLAAPGFTDPGSAVQDPDQISIVVASRDVAQAQAKGPHETAQNTFYTVRYALWNKLYDPD